MAGQGTPAPSEAAAWHGEQSHAAEQSARCQECFLPPAGADEAQPSSGWQQHCPHGCARACSCHLGSRRSWVLCACCTHYLVPWHPHPAPRAQGCASSPVPYTDAHPHILSPTRAWDLFPHCLSWACTHCDCGSLPGSTGCLGVQACGFVKYGPYKSRRV